MMTLATDVQDKLRRFVSGLVSADDLSDWLDANAQQIHDCGDANVRQLTDLTLSLLEDVFQGQRSLEEAQRVLQEKAPISVSR